MRDERLVRLENGRSRRGLADHLIDLASADPDVIVGLDFAFSLPAWFLRDRELPTAYELWSLAEEEGERESDPRKPCVYVGRRRRTRQSERRSTNRGSLRQAPSR